MDQKRPAPTDEDEQVDEASEESFPASDAPANTPVEGDRKADREKKR